MHCLPALVLHGVRDAHRGWPHRCFLAFHCYNIEFTFSSMTSWVMLVISLG